MTHVTIGKSKYYGKDKGETLEARMRKVGEAVRERFPSMPNANTYAWPRDTFDDAVIVSYESGGRSRLYAIDYEDGESGVKLADEMTEVAVKQHYEVVEKFAKRGGYDFAALKDAAKKSRARKKPVGQ